MRASPSRTDPTRRRLGPLLALLVAGTAPAVATAAEGAPRALKRATRSALDVALPAVELVRDDGETVELADELGEGGPVVLTFIFTKCGTICPVMSRTFAALQEKLGGEAREVRLLSISIDPEFDTPKRLAEYGRRVGAGRRWHFYTGTAEASVSAQRAFEVFRGDKMNHTPVTFLRAGGGSRWERIDGFASPDELAGEVRQLLVSR